MSRVARQIYTKSKYFKILIQLVSEHLDPSPIVGLACAPIVETRFLELAMSLLDFSPRIPLGTFSILLRHFLASILYMYF